MDEPSQNPPKSKTSWLKSTLGFLTGTTMLLAFCLLVFSIFGFSRFATNVQAHQNDPLMAQAEAVVVFTGGKHRIQTATELLMQRKAKRMLISGVNTNNTEKQVGKTVGIDPQILKCCVDFDYQALDTKGNALHTADWIRKNGFKKVIVVTSDYHLPRGMLELRRAMPDIELEPFAVKYAGLQNPKWYTDPETMKVIVTEYSKFLAASLRIDYQDIDTKLAKFASANGF